MKIIKIRKCFCLLFALMVFSSIITAQNKYSVTDSVSGNQINIYHSDLRQTKIVVGNQYIYSGLDSFQLLKFDTLNNKVIRLSSQIEKFDALIETNKSFGDSILKLTREMSIYQREINELNRINDSVKRSLDEVDKYKQKLVSDYNAMIKDALGEFWEENPDFDPYNNIQYQTMYEKLTGTQCSTLNNNSTFSIPKYGPINRLNLQQKYTEYYELIKNYSFYVDRQLEYFNRYRKDINCTDPFGTIIINNKLNKDVNFYFRGIDSNGGCVAAKKSTTTLKYYISTYSYDASIISYDYNGNKKYTTVQSGAFVLYACEEFVITLE